MLIRKEVTCSECGKRYFETFWFELLMYEGVCPECLDCMDNE